MVLRHFSAMGMRDTLVIRKKGDLVEKPFVDIFFQFWEKFKKVGFKTTLPWVKKNKIL